MKNKIVLWILLSIIPVICAPDVCERIYATKLLCGGEIITMSDELYISIKIDSVMYVDKCCHDRMYVVHKHNGHDIYIPTNNIIDIVR
jgi:hypothetical protein